MRHIPRWLRWILVVAAVLIVLGVVAWIVASRAAERRLQAEIDLVRAAGAPLTLDEIEWPAIPDADNAARVYERSFALLVDEDAHTGDDLEAWNALSEARDALDEDPLGLDEENTAILEGWLEANADALALLPEALERPECRFERALSVHPFAHESPTVRPVQVITELLQVKALAAFRGGDVDAAFDALTLGVRVADQAMQPPTMINVMVCGGAQHELLHVAELLLTRDTPSPEVLSRLIAAVEAMEREGILVRALVFERAFAGSAYAWGLAGAPEPESEDSEDGQGGESPVPGGLLGDVLFRWDHARYLRLVRQAIELAERPYYESRGEWERLGDEATDGSAVEVFSRMLAVPWRIFVTRWVRHEARLDVTRLGLRIELYRLETGALPARLADLGPEVAALVDPFSGEPYRYRQEEDGGFVVYGVGEDGEDDGGTEDEDDPGRPDIVFRVPAHD